MNEFIDLGNECIPIQRISSITRTSNGCMVSVMGSSEYFHSERSYDEVVAELTMMRVRVP